MYKSLLVVSLFSLSASAMDKPKVETPSAKTVGLAALAASYATHKCVVPTIVGGPFSGMTCLAYMGAAYSAAHVATNYVTQKPESK